MFAVGLARKQDGVVDFEMKKPEIKGPRDVLVKLLQAGIDGTDRDMIQRGQKDIGEGEDFIVLGHEAMGRVEEVGQGVQSLKPGDLVPAGSGVRAQALDREGSLLDDFHIVQEGRALHVCNAPSPAATASLAIGDKIAELAAAQFTL